MSSSVSPAQLSTLTAWAELHIPQVYEAPTASAAKEAIETTFSPNLHASVNGKMGKTRDNFLDSALKIQKGWVEGRKVVWTSIVEVPDDETNRSGTVGAVYKIVGVKVFIPGSDKVAEFERHKCVIVRIESQSEDLSFDSRMIVDITAVEKKVEIKGGLSQ